jgi:hypothetical protein
MTTWKRVVSIRHYYRGSVIRLWGAGSVASCNPDHSANRGESHSNKNSPVLEDRRLTFAGNRTKGPTAATLEGSGDGVPVVDMLD